MVYARLYEAARRKVSTGAGHLRAKIGLITSIRGRS